MVSILYDDQGRREEIARDALGTITDYGYDPISRLESLDHDLDGSTTTNDVMMGFDYNPASQIVQRSMSNDAYEYPLTSENLTYAVNGRNQYTQIGGDAPATLAWDANGNLTSDGATSFGYDVENRLTSASGAKNASLSYDPLGRLYEVATPSSTTRFVYDGDRLIAEYNGSGTLLHRYVHGAGVDEPLVWYEGASVSAGNRRYLHANHQGSIVALTGASGTTLEVNAYDAYGVTGASNTGRFQYTGQAAVPELGLYYYKARFYNPGLGRFMQTDPIGYDDHMNMYAYVGNDPVNATDPTGRFGIIGAIVGGAIGGVVSYGAQVYKDVKGGASLRDAATSTAAAKAATTGALTGALVGSGAGIVTATAGATVIGGGVEATAGALTGDIATAGEIGAAAFNNAVATAGGVGAGKLAEKAVGAVLTGARAAGAAQAAANGAISPQSASAIGSTAIDVSGTVTGEVAGHAAGAYVTVSTTENVPSEVVQRGIDKLRQ